MATETRYLRIFGLHRATITKVEQTEYKGQKSLCITFRGVDDRLIDAKFKLPIGEISKKQLANMMKCAGVKGVKELNGKELVILVSPSDVEKNGHVKRYWNITKFFPVSYAELIGAIPEEQGLDDIFGVDEAHEPPPHKDDDLGINF